jgi:hypothetical protein
MAVRDEGSLRHGADCSCYWGLRSHC